ncbi:MAG: helix-turn-helix transcriptional regulator [Intestinibacter sp.]
MNRIFNGEATNPTISTAYKIAKVLGVKIDDLLKGSD